MASQLAGPLHIEGGLLRLSNSVSIEAMVAVSVYMPLPGRVNNGNWSPY